MTTPDVERVLLPVTIRFLADADVKQDIVNGLRRLEPTIDIIGAHRGEIIGLPDPGVLAAAAAMGRVLISHDRRTMPGHFGRFIAHNESPGLIIVPQKLPIRITLDQLLLMWAAMTAEEIRNVIYSLPL